MTFNALLILSFVASLLALVYFVSVRPIYKSRQRLHARPPPPSISPPPHAPPLSPFPPPAPFSAQRLALATNLIVHAAHANATRFTHTLPTTRHVEDVMRRLQGASCAVVGAAPTLKRCRGLERICAHDVVIRVNDHAPFDACGRCDIAVANQLACSPAVDAALEPLSTLTNATRARLPDDGDGVPRETLAAAAGWNGAKRAGERGGPCRTRRPLLFRLRSEWSPPSGPPPDFFKVYTHRSGGEQRVRKQYHRKPNSSRYFAADGSWLLARGATAERAHAEVLRWQEKGEPTLSKAATTGGVAVEFALEVCASVSLFGLGGAGGLDAEGRAALRQYGIARAGGWGALLDHQRGVGRYAYKHMVYAERRWLADLARQRKVDAVCF